MEHQSKEVQSYGNPEFTDAGTFQEMNESKLSPHISENDYFQIAAVDVIRSCEEPLKPSSRITIPNPNRSLKPVTKSNGHRKFARANQCQQQRRTHFSQTKSSHISESSGYIRKWFNASLLDIMDVKQNQVATAAAGNKDCNLVPPTPIRNPLLYSHYPSKMTPKDLTFSSEALVL